MKITLTKSRMVFQALTIPGTCAIVPTSTMSPSALLRPSIRPLKNPATDSSAFCMAWAKKFRFSSQIRLSLILFSSSHCSNSSLFSVSVPGASSLIAVSEMYVPSPNDPVHCASYAKWDSSPELMLVTPPGL